MTKLGIALLVTAAVISVIFTAIFGPRFFVELSSWLMIATGFAAAGLLLLVLGRPQPQPESGIS